jgi:4-amino-4-deoxy-L-arabinose transferase-like glycosyltransferase
MRWRCWGLRGSGGIGVAGVGGIARGCMRALVYLHRLGRFCLRDLLFRRQYLSLFLLTALYLFLSGLEHRKVSRIYLLWALLGLSVLIKGLIAPVFFFGAVMPYLLWTGEWRRWREMRIFSGILLFFVVAAPWHILVGLANPDQGHAVGNHPTVGNVHGFWWFYFVNEHILRFFGQRYPHDYNKLPFAAYWLLHLVWLFPWSLFLPAVGLVVPKVFFALEDTVAEYRRAVADSAARSVLLIGLFCAFTLLFFGISTNQEYYTFPVWPLHLC